MQILLSSPKRIIHPLCHIFKYFYCKNMTQRKRFKKQRILLTKKITQGRTYSPLAEAGDGKRAPLRQGNFWGPAAVSGRPYRDKCCCGHGNETFNAGTAVKGNMGIYRKRCPRMDIFACFIVLFARIHSTTDWNCSTFVFP